MQENQELQKVSLIFLAVFHILLKKGFRSGAERYLYINMQKWWVNIRSYHGDRCVRLRE